MRRQSLPIDASLAAIVAGLVRERRLILQAPPGTGKTTRVPPALLDSKEIAGEVWVLEPRRVAARAAAQRVAFERGVAVGEEVGYQVRFDRRASARTRLRFVTDGILLRHLQQDASLSGIGALVFDEFHERSLEGDLCLALAREAQGALRPDLCLLVMSATLDAAPLAGYLEAAPVMEVAANAYPVEVRHEARAEGEALEVAVARAVAGLLRDLRGDGSVLVFVPGAAEIRRCVGALAGLAATHGYDVMPLHGELALEEQMRAIGRGLRPRLIVSTNVAEASLTVEGVTAVVDSGLQRVARFDPVRGTDALRTERVSRDSAVQRAGRAGREAPGTCVRLFSCSVEDAMAPSSDPEVARVDLTGAMLQLLAWSATDPRKFGWLTAPSEERVDGALRLLEMFGATETGTWRLTEIGRGMAALAVSPRTARLLVEASRRGVVEEACLVAALLEERDPRVERRAQFGGQASAGSAGGAETVDRSDLLWLAHRIEGREWAGLEERGVRRILQSAAQLRRAAPRTQVRWSGAGVASRRDGSKQLLLAILAAHPDRIVRRHAERRADGVMVGGLGVRLDARSVVREGRYFVAHDASDARDGGGRFVRVERASEVELEWIREVLPGALRSEDAAQFDDTTERVVGVRRVMLGDLVLEERSTGAVERDLASRVLWAAVERAPEKARGEDLELEELRARLLSLLGWRPEFAASLGGASVESIEMEALRMLCEGRKSFAELRSAKLSAAVLTLLPADLARALDLHAPAKITLPSGRAARVEYRPGDAPVVAGRLQEFFGSEKTPTVAGGSVPVVLHLLAPNSRPVQITSDLGSFWSRVYPKIRTELRRRYPRHAWPDDPLTARPESRPARRP